MGTKRIFKTIGIIGGKGLIGSFFSSVFRQAGFSVLVSDIETKLSNKELIAQADIVAFAVPLHKTEKIIRGLAKHGRHDQLWIDFTSIKTPAVNAMLRSKAEVIGLHPMFRPSPSGLKNQNIVMCPARAGLSAQRLLRGIFEARGARITVMPAKKHDKLMAVVQVLIHSRAIILGNLLRELKVNIEDTLSVMSPVYRLEFDLMGRIFAQDPNLYGSILMHNPEGKHALKMAEKETFLLNEIIRKQDLEKFDRMFEKTAKYLGKHKIKALEESNKLLQYFRF